MTTAADKLDKVDRLLDDASRLTADREHGLAIGCTEWQSAWCPIHGDCCCENTDDWKPGTNGCKLHLPERTPVGLIIKNEDGEPQFDPELYRRAVREGMSVTIPMDCSGLNLKGSFWTERGGMK